MTRLLVMLTGLAFLAGCPDNQYDYKTWTKKLGDPHEAERAVTELEQLGQPGAIPDLGEAWQSHGKPVRYLQVIISLARELTPEEAKAKFVVDFEKTGRKASWDKALPYLTAALTEVDEANPRSVDGASKAAEALGEARLSEGLDALIELGTKAPNKKLITAQIAAIRAMGKFETDKAKAAAALTKIIDRDGPDHPKTAKDKEQRRALDERFGLHLGVTGAAINALGELRVPASAKTLVLAMYRTPELFMQTRRALVATGPAAKDELVKVLLDKHAEVNQLFKDKRLDRYCGDRGDAPPDQCQPVSAKDFYPAVVLGDFYDPSVATVLLDALDRPAAPVYFMDDQPSPNTQYHALFDSLRKIGSNKAAERVRAKWMAKDADPAVKALAISVYPFVTSDDNGVAELGKIAGDNSADDGLRQEAATAFARLSRDAKSLGVLEGLADKYFKASADRQKEAQGKPKQDADAADKVFDQQAKALATAKSDLVRLTNDKSKSVDEIKAATAAVKKLEDEFKEHRKTHRAATAQFKQLENASKAYKGYARMFQTHIARIEVAIRCQQDLACYAATLKLTPEEAANNVGKYIKDIKSWTDDEKKGLVEANVERAMLEIAKAGDKASGFAESLLDAAKSDVRLIRQSILLALPKIVKSPCDSCVTKLDTAIKAGEGKTTLGDLNHETTMLRNYFAGGKSAPEAAKSAE